MSSASTIVIPRCTGVCAGSGRALEPGERIVVVLLEPVEPVEGEGFERLDYAALSWEDGARPEAGREVFAVWHAAAPSGGKRQEGLISAEGLLDLFEQLAETEEPRRRAFRYVLALQLMRKRQLEYAGARGGVLLVRPRGAEADAPAIEVHDPQASGELDERALEELAEQVEALMEPGDAA
ncbi:MAG: hypothetical protein ACTS22_01210 [Phycisphaerales bacterium]